MSMTLKLIYYKLLKLMFFYQNVKEMIIAPKNENKIKYLFWNN